MKVFPVVAVLLVANLDNTAGNSAWDYGAQGPSTWRNNYPTCGNKSQSPIDIVDSAVTSQTKSVPFVTSSLSAPTSMIIHNNGHSLQVDMTGGYTIKNAAFLPNSYKAVQYHFHWGNTTGSEHKLKGQQFFGEMHIVHYNTKYPNISQALNQPKGLAVLAFFIKDTASTNNVNFAKITDQIKNGFASNANKNIPAFAPSLLLPKLSVYYRYDGSLTTPPCSETVIWTVFKEPIEISAAQATILKTNVYKTGTTPVIDNFRPTQPLNGRKILKYTISGAAGYKAQGFLATFFLTALVCILN
ncbi:carbonic anhydrase-like [Ciona intestinalis]